MKDRCSIITNTLLIINSKHMYFNVQPFCNKKKVNPSVIYDLKLISVNKLRNVSNHYYVTVLSNN